MLKVDDHMGITLTRGDSAVLSVTIYDGEEVYDYSNDTVKFAVKRNALDSQVLLEKEVNEDGQVVLEPSDTASMQFGDYIYSITVYHVTEAESAEEEDVTDVYTPIVSRFSLGYNLI